MITSSLNRIIKSGSDIEIEQFIPPVQTDAAPEKQVRAETWTAPAASLPDREEYRTTSEAIETAEREAGEILAKAKQITDDLLREAEEQADQVKKAAAAEGHREGYEQGYREGQEKARGEQEEFLKQQQEDFKKNLSQALELAEQAKDSCLRTYLDELKNCAVSVAEKVIHISLNSSGEIIKRMLIAETEKLKKRAWVKIYMEKTDYDMMVETDPDVVGELAKLSDNIKFVVMNKENSGNCIIEMPDEIVDISVDTQMENIREILENVRF